MSLAYLAWCRDANGARPVEVHVGELVRQLLEDVRRNVGVVADDDEVDGRDGALRHPLADEEEVVPCAPRDVVVDHGARGRVLVLAGLRDVVQSRVDPLLHHNVGELGHVAVQIFEAAQELRDLVVVNYLQLRVRHAVAEDHDQFRPSLVVEVVGLEAIEKGDLQGIAYLLLGLLLGSV